MEHEQRRAFIREIAKQGAIPSELGPWLRQVRDALRTAGTKRRIPGRTADRQRARHHLRVASRWVTAAMRSLGNAGDVARPAAEKLSP